MQIHKAKNTKKRSPSFWWIVGAAMLLFLLYFLFTDRSEGAKFCDMESRTADQKYFVTNGVSFNNGQTQSDHKVRSGKYSAKVDSKNLYGPGYTFEHVYSGDVYEASIWMNNDNGFGTLAFSGTWDFYVDQKESSKTENDWHLLKKRIEIPAGVYDEKLIIFPYTNKDSRAVYFDDFTVEKITSGNSSSVPALSDEPNKRLDIQVDKSSLEKLKAKRIEAYTKGNLISSKDDLVPAKINTGTQSIDAQIRLKGDLLDHLTGKKWSFRIHTDDGHAWNGMKVFSVHNSKSRDHLSEWVFHAMLSKEDVLTTKYDYIELALNGESLGIYAYEEHFLKQLLQDQNRSEGPILKISEDAHWQYAPRPFGNKLAHYEGAQIEPFDKNALKKSNSYTETFEKGQELLHGFIHGDLEVEDVFDTDRFAKYIAIQDICNAWHSFNYTNLRFYFNPQSGKLEPIGFDGFTPDGLRYNKDLFITGSQVNSLSTQNITAHKFVKHFHKKLFTNFEFAAKYIYHLDRLSDAAYLDNFKKETEVELRSREQFIRKGYNSYVFNWDAYFDNAEQINEILGPAEELSIKAYRDGSDVVLRSYHLLPLEVIGFGNKEINSKPDGQVILESYDKTKPVLEQRVLDPSRSKRVYVRTLGTNRILSFPIFKWKAPALEKSAAINMNQNVAASFMIDSPNAYIIPAGRHTLRNSLVVKDKQLVIQAGAEVDLQNGASIISTHSIQALGNVDKPIVIRSSNNSGQGIVIINSQAKSSFKSCTFDNLQATKQFSLHTDGGVNIFQSEVDFNRCVFTNAKSKDALHLDNCEYKMYDCVFRQASGDGMDANYSNGIVENINLQNIGKDAIEISGGFIRLTGAKCKQSSGSIINANLHATLELNYLEISNSSEGIKSTDLSEVILKNISMKDVETGLLAFRKNDEMGGGIIKAFGLKEDKVGKRNVQDIHSSIFLDNQKLPSQ